MIWTQKGALGIAFPPEASEQEQRDSITSLWLEVVEASQASCQVPMKIDNARRVDIGTAKARMSLPASSSTQSAPPKAIDVQLLPRVAHNYIGNGLGLGSSTAPLINRSEPFPPTGPQIIHHFLNHGGSTGVCG